MNKIVDVADLWRRFRSVLDEAVRRLVAYIVTRANRPDAVPIAHEHCVCSTRTDEAEVRQRFDATLARMALANAKYSDTEIEADLRSATQAVRSRKRK